MTADQKNALAGVVTIDRDIIHGTPCFAHTRVPVQTLIDFLETGETIDDFLAVYPAILRQHVFSFLELSRDMDIDPRVAAYASSTSASISSGAISGARDPVSTA